jgi:hypothetical protein
VANAQVCKTCIRGFESRPVLQNYEYTKNVAPHLWRGVQLFLRALGSVEARER